MNTIRIWFTKTGEASYISLLDLQRVMHRCLKRSGLPVWYTMGFNPHIYLTFACPLPLGQESLTDCVDCKTEQETPDFEAWKQALNSVMPLGIVITKVEKAGLKAEHIGFARYTVTSRDERMAGALLEYNALPSALVQKKSKRGMKEIDLKQHIPEIHAEACAEGCRFTLLLPASDTLNLNPALLLKFVEEHYAIPAVNSDVLRTEFLAKNGEKFC